MPDTIHKTAIKDELEKVLSSKGFNRSPLLSRFLRFVVENTLDGKSNQIKEYTVAVRVLDKPNKFNPQLDASVRIHASRLRNMLSEYYQEHNEETIFRIDLPKGGYVPVFTEPSKEHKLKTFANLEEQWPDDTVCILPFSGFIQHVSFDFSIPRFCELLSKKLSQFQDINVVPYQSALQFKREGGRLEDAGSALGVSYYLTGSIELEKDKLLFSFQLFEAQNNIIIWSHNTSVSLLQTGVKEAADTISNKVVASLAGYSGFLHYRKVWDRNLIPPLTNKKANAIFWFNNYQFYQTEDSFFAAIKQLEEVVDLDGNCALCWSVLAHLYADAIVYNFYTQKKPLETAIECLNKAFLLDPDCQHAHLANALIHIITRNKMDAVAAIEKTDSLNPNSSSFKAMCSLGMALLGEYTTSLAYLEKVMQLNPHPYWWINLPEIFVALKNNSFEKVIYLARKSGTQSFIYEHIFEMIGLYYSGDTNTLKQVLQKYKTKYPGGLVFVEKALTTILIDDELVRIISYGLQEIGKIENAITEDYLSMIA